MPLREEGVSLGHLLPGRVRPTQPPTPPGQAVGRGRREAQGPRARTPAAHAGGLQPLRRSAALFAAYDLPKDKLYGHIKPTKNRTTKKCRHVADWAAANNVEVAYTPTNSSWLNRIEPQFTALRYFALDGTDHRSHKEQGSHDPPLHHLAKPPRRRHPPTSGRRPSQRGLTSDCRTASPQPAVLVLMSGASRVNSRNPTL